MKLPTYEEIKPYIEKKLVSEQVHPENEDVRIFNYTQMCQFDRAWDDITRQCRGLIVNVKTGEVLARPFPKFFNYAEHVQNEWPIPNEIPVITEKFDGSLGILYVLNGRPWVATRGSFMSDQAQWATKWFRENVGDSDIVYWLLEHDITHLFEIIYPENRIVVNYDFQGLVHLASLETRTGNTIEAPLSAVRKADVLLTTKMPTPENIAELTAGRQDNREGIVIFFPTANVRMKVKLDEYVRLHKIITGVSEIGIWEILKDNGDFTPLLEKVPDEFHKWVSDTRTKLWEKFGIIATEATLQFERIGRKAPVDRKAWAEEIKKMTNPGIGFALLDEKDYKQIIWKMVRPHGPRVFKTDIDL